MLKNHFHVFFKWEISKFDEGLLKIGIKGWIWTEFMFRRIL